MTEKDKMLNGEFYNPMDTELVTDRMEARKLLYSFNNSKPSEGIRRKETIKQLFGKTGAKIYIEPPFRCDYGYNIEVGENFYANFDCVILDVNKVIMGDDVQLGPGVHIYTAVHPTDPEERMSKTEYGEEIEIGNNVWIGGGAIICSGVKIGSNTTIGAGSVVTKDISENVLAVGNPCKVIKKFD
ncbi:MAG TPA: sugar O-acetyltransferase [Halanaerobiales bacterium]|nr:sugar O-acetyltransferase [Halanaerobiales bacterium]